MHKFIGDICDGIGPRESGTEQDILAGNKIEDELKRFCDETWQEEYTSSPTAFLGFIRYGVLLVIFSVIFYWLSLIVELQWLIIDSSFILYFLIIAFILLLISVIYFILEVMKYHEIFDFLFKKKQSKNVVGTLNPTDEVKNTVIFSGHHDSAYEFNLFYYLKTVGVALIFVGYVGILVIFLMTSLKLIFYFLSINFFFFFYMFGIIFLFFLPITIAFLFFHSYNPVPGAFDNLSAVSIVLGIGKLLDENKSKNDFYPKHTKILLISFAGEEAGLRNEQAQTQAPSGNADIGVV